MSDYLKLPIGLGLSDVEFQGMSGIIVAGGSIRQYGNLLFVNVFWDYNSPATQGTIVGKLKTLRGDAPTQIIQSTGVGLERNSFSFSPSTGEFTFNYNDTGSATYGDGMNGIVFLNNDSTSTSASYVNFSLPKTTLRTLSYLNVSKKLENVFTYGDYLCVNIHFRTSSDIPSGAQLVTLNGTPGSFSVSQHIVGTLIRTGMVDDQLPLDTTFMSSAGAFATQAPLPANYEVSITGMLQFN